jgi:hypothetical protein
VILIVSPFFKSYIKVNQVFRQQAQEDGRHGLANHLEYIRALDVIEVVLVLLIWEGVLLQHP